MKPSAPTTNGEFKRSRSKAELIQQNFQPGGDEPFGRARFGWPPGEPSRKRSIYRMTGDYFRREMHRDFFLEATAFSIIVLISAWPITSMMLMLMQLIR